MSASQLTLRVSTPGLLCNVVMFDLARKPDVLAAVKRLAEAIPDADWCIVDHKGEREWIKPLTTPERESMRTLNRALTIADHAARSDIECYALGIDELKDGGWLYDLTQPSSSGAGETDETMALQVEIARRAAAHIRSRPEGTFPWRLRHVEGATHLVWFEKLPEKKGKARGRK
ncbi:MAG: hypothetical protein NVV60_01560 [Luteimonas sp.]|nr:hypothetical protein [Luteimonas sp.]